MEPQPPLRRGAPNAAMIRNVMLSEIALHVSDSAKARANATRTLAVAIGSGSGERFQPWLRLTDGSPFLAHAIVRGELDVTFMNPSALLTQAYRGVGLFREPLLVRVIASYPSWDRYLHAIHPRTGITSMQQLKEQRYPLRLSIRASGARA